MGATTLAERRVERLRLRAPDETLGGRALRLIEDAFRTATLPDGRARVTVVRRLALPRFDADSSPQALSLAIERQVAALSSYVMHADEAGAAAAPAVWFRDALEAHTLLALRLLDRKAADEWFWPLAVPRAFEAYGGERLRAVVLSLCDLPEARAALPAFVRALGESGRIERLAHSLREADAPMLATVAGVTRERMQRLVEDAPFAATVLQRSAPRASPAPFAFTREALVDARVLALAAIALEAEASMPSIAVRQTREARDAQAAPIARNARTEMRTEARSRAPDSSEPSDAPIARRDERSAPPPAPVEQSDTAIPDSASTVEWSDSTAPAATRGPASRTRQVAAAEDSPAHVTEPEPATRSAWPSGEPTLAGGLLFLVPVLDRLGFGAWLDQSPAYRGLGIERRLFARVCERLAIPPGDPAWLLARYDDAQSGLPPGLVDAIAKSWLTACRRCLRRGARIGIATLVARPARLTLTPTHADVAFALGHASMAVRRAGLDLDPGWVPWLGRVVAFHYLADFERWT
ncbi:MAG TPA: hypothetical protein VHP37_19705 [Burkholderiales bacterium]|nr:hypothetical protein [Burkholderiales bacterium]